MISQRLRSFLSNKMRIYIYIALYSSFMPVHVRIPFGEPNTCTCIEIFKTTVDMPPRNKIPLEHRQRIVRAFEDDAEDYLLVADTLGVNRSTARSIVRRYIREGRIQERRRGGRNTVRVDEEMRNCRREIINENSLPTFWQINRELRRRLPDKLFIHDRTMARTLDGTLLRVKLARPLPARF